MNGSTVTIREARLGRDPELRTVGEQGTPVCDLWLAWDDFYGEKKRTNWCGATLWGDDAEAAADSLEKGSKIAIRGHLRSEEYDAKDGTKRRVVKIVADQVQFESSRPGAASEESAEPPTRQGKRAA